MSAIDEVSADAAPGDAAPLSETMLIMDVADLIRHDPSLAEDRTRLAANYERLGLTPNETTLSLGVTAWRNQRFVYQPAKPGLGTTLARLYVWRRHWLPPAIAVLLMFVIGFGGYFLVYRPYRAAQIEQSRIELAETLPAQMDALYQSIHEETKVQQAENDALAARDRGKDAAAKGDRPGAEAAIAELTRIRDTLQQEYQLMIVDRAGTKWGFWTFPDNNSDETNYYLVVEGRDQSGTALELPIHNEQTGKTETVAAWGIRVPEQVYRAVEADKLDDGIIEHTLIGVKEYGFLDTDYVVQVLGGTVTRW